MDAYQQIWTQQSNSCDLPQNLSFKTQGLENRIGNGSYDNDSDFSIYCMSDSIGCLHFSLSAYPESTLNPFEQKNLGRQLPEYIKDHFDKYKRDHDQAHLDEIILEESEHFRLQLEALYDDFITYYPRFNLDYQTYIKALRSLSSLKKKTPARMPAQAQISGANCSDYNNSNQKPTPLPSICKNSSVSSAYDKIQSPGKTSLRDDGESSERQCEEKVSERLNEKEMAFLNQPNICRKADDVSGSEEDPQSISHCHQPSEKHKSSIGSNILSNISHIKKSMSSTQPSPLPLRCSCTKHKCSSLFSQNEREQICKKFWCGKNSKGNLRWVGASVQGHFPNKCKSRSHFHKSCLFIGKYFLHKSGTGKQNVCKPFFLSTLGLHFLFPLYNSLKQKTLKNASSSSSKMRKRKSKKKSFLKHLMKKHIYRHFLRHFFHQTMPNKVIVSQAKKAFKRFSIQFPHFLEKKSFKRYLSIISKLITANKRCSAAPLPSHNTRGNASILNHGIQGTHSHSDPSASNNCEANGRIMKIKPEDFDEVLQNDLEEKLMAADNDSYDEGCSFYTEGKRSKSMKKAKSNSSLKIDTSVPHHPKDSTNTDLSLSQLYPENFRKAPKRTYNKKGKGSSKQSTEQKQKATVSKKKYSKNGSAAYSSYPKKNYKIAVNEIEDDQSKHPILPACNCSKSKCCDKVPDEQRKAIHTAFWNLDNISRRAWMVKHVHILKPKSRSNRATARLHKMHRKFFLPDSSDELHNVCKKFFLATLGFKGVGVLRPQKIPGAKSSTPEKEKRRRILSYQVCQQDVVSVIQYCKSFNQEKDVRFCGDERFTRPTNGDFTSGNSLQKISVPYGFTWKELYKDYCTKHSNVDFGYQTFRSILSIVEHNNFSEDLLDKFQKFLGTDSGENMLSQLQETIDSEQSSSSFQEHCSLLQSFPKIQKVIKKIPKEKEPVVNDVRRYKNRITKKSPKPCKKLKLAKSFVSHDINPAVKCIKPRNTRSTRYNFREGVPLVTYSFDTEADNQNDDFLYNDWEEEEDYCDIKEEVTSDTENSKVVKKTVKKTDKKIKKQGKLLHKKKEKHVGRGRPRKVPVEVGDKPKPLEASGELIKKKRGRKRKSWELKVDVKQRESTVRLKSRHPVLPPCKCNYRKCHEKIPEQQREVIHSLYWGISSKQERCKWVLEHIKRGSPKTRSNTGLPSRKRESRRYFLPNEQNEIIEVCRVFFLRTLGYQWDSVVDTVSRALPRPGGHLAKSLGFTQEQLPYEIFVQIKKYLKHKKIRKTSIAADQFPDDSHNGDDDNNEIDENFTLEGYLFKDLYHEFTEVHPENNLDISAFKRIVHFILVPNSEAQSEWDIKQEQLKNEWGTKGDAENQGDGANNLSRDGSGRDPNVVYFTPEFERQDIEKALTRKARRRRPVSSRNCKEQHPIREPCNCIRRCREKIDHRKREEIHEQYWNLITYNQRKQWILEHIKREAPKRRTNLTGPIKKTETRKFYFENWSGDKKEICKGFFLATLGFKWDKMVDTICKTTPRDGRYVRPDQRGKKPPSHKLSETLVASVTEYIDSVLETASYVYPKTPARTNVGKQKKAPDRMPYGLTMKNLFEDYKIKHPQHKVGYESFRKIYRTVIQSEKFQPASLSPSQIQDEEDEPAMEPLPPAPQQMGNISMLPLNIDNSSVDRTGEQDLPHFDTSHQSCMYKNPTGMRLHNPEQAHLPPYQRQCDSSIMKSFPEGMNSFSKSHDVQFFPANLEQNEEMSMQMYKSICMPTSNPNQTYPFYPNSLPLDTFPMSSTSQGLHGGLPYSESLRHSDLMHPHPYQPAHHHFSQSRFHGFVLPGSSTKVPEPSHHQHSDMNVSHNYRNEFDCNLYPGKNPLIYPPAYHHADNMPSSSAQRHFNIPMHSHGIHDIRARDSASASASANLLMGESSSSNSCQVPTSVPAASTNQPTGNDWQAHTCVMSMNKGSQLEASQEKKNSKKPKGRPSKRQPKEKVPKVKREKKVRPKSNRNSREYNPMLPPCGCSVKKCLEKIPEPRREVIYNSFWDLGDYNNRKQWIAEHISREDPKRRTSLDNPLRRMETRRFYLTNENGEKMEVCKGFFLRTLGFKWDKMVDTICKTTEKGQTTVRPDMRGKKGPSHKLNEEVAMSVESYVKSILQAAKPTYEAIADHSEEQEQDKDIFVPYGLTIKNFHLDYKGKHADHKVGYESFRKIFQRVSKEVHDSVSLEEEDEKDSLKPASSEKGENDVINPVTGLPQEMP